MNTLVYVLVQLLAVLLVAPLFGGIIKKIKAVSQKRKGAPVLQLYFDLYKLMRKTAVVSETASWIYKVAPYVVFVTALAAALLTPVTTTVMPEGLFGDAIMAVSVLALGRFFLMAAALDTGSTFGGMGSSREAMISSLIEPSILVSVFTVGLLCGSTSLPGIMNAMKTQAAPLIHPVFILIALALILIILAETARIPVDDPSTHLELTMVHEAMILEYSGRHLALMEYGAAVKQLVFVTLLVNIMLPSDQLVAAAGAAAVAASLALYLLKVVLTAVVIGLIEVGTVKFRLFSVPNLAALAFILSFLGFLQSFVFGGAYV